MLKKLTADDVKDVFGGIIVKRNYWGGNTRDYNPLTRFYTKDSTPSYFVFKDSDFNLKAQGGYNEDALGRFSTYKEALKLAKEKNVSTALVDFTLENN